MSERIKWIDCLKGFGIFCVTFGHLHPNMYLETYVYSFHMFLFLFISGYLFKQRNLKEYIKRKIKSILIPLIVWDVLSCSVYLITGEINKIIKYGTFITGFSCWNSPIWFLLVLFFAEVIYAFVLDVFKSKWSSIVVMVISLLLFLLFNNKVLPFMIDLIPMALFAFSFGDNFSKLINKNYFNKNNTTLLIIISGILSVIFGMFLNTRISYYFRDFGNIIYCLIASISGMIFYTMLFKSSSLFDNLKLLPEIGKNSLFIMASQYWFFRIYSIVSTKLFGVNIWKIVGTLKALILSLITISLCMLFICIYKKLFKTNKVMMKISNCLGIK